MKLYLLILTTIFLTQYNLSESSFAQNSNEIFGPKTSSPENSEKTIIKPTLVTQQTDTPETATAVPDVTSNISLIITPDIVNPLANEDPTSSDAISKIPTDDNTTTNDIKDKASTNGNQNNNNNNTNDSDVITPSNTNDSDVITPSNTNIDDSRNDVITTPTAAAANNATSSQGNSSGSGTSAATAAAANNATSSQGNSSGSGTSAATAAAANNGSQITSNSSQGTNNNGTTNKSINSSANSEVQTSSPPAFPWFDEFFKFFEAK